MAGFKLHMKSWEDGSPVEAVLDNFDRWLVHAAHEVTVEPHAINATRLGVGACLWEGALALSVLLVQQPQYRYIGQRCVELGAGVGLVGLLLAKLGAKVILTDMDIMLPLLRENAQLNSLPSRGADGEGSVEVRELEWGKEGYEQVVGSMADPPVDLVVAADCCYVDQERGSSPSTEHFINACAGLCGPTSRCLVSFELRSSDVKRVFLEAASRAFRKVERVDHTLLPKSYRPEHIEIYELRK